MHSSIYQASGGGQVFSYSVDNPEAASVDPEGVVTTTASGPVSFKVKAYMAQSEHNFDESQVSFKKASRLQTAFMVHLQSLLFIIQVHILPATSMEIATQVVEFATHGSAKINLKMMTLLPESNKKVIFTDCSEVPYEVTLSDPENFEVEGRSSKYLD